MGLGGEQVQLDDNKLLARLDSLRGGWDGLDADFGCIRLMEFWFGYLGSRGNGRKRGGKVQTNIDYYYEK